MSAHPFTAESSLSLTHYIAGLPCSTFTPFQNSSQPSTPHARALHRISKSEFSHSEYPRKTIIYADVYPRNQPSRPLQSCPQPPVLPTKSPNSIASISSPPSMSDRTFSNFRPDLRRKRSPKIATLRQLRIKYSEADLQKMYEVQTMAYFDGSLPISPVSPSVPAFRLLLTSMERV